MKIKLLALSTLAFTSTLWLGTGAYYFVKIEQAWCAQELAANVHIDLLKAYSEENKFLLRSLRNPDFYKSGTSEEIQSHQAAMVLTREQIALLEQVSTSHDLTEELSSSVDTYNERFEKLVAAYHKRGFKDWGLIGRFRKAVHSLEKSLVKENHLELKIDMLQLRRNEKDYLLRGERKYIDRVVNQLDRIRKGVRLLDDGSGGGFLKLLDDYEKSFQDLLSVDERIGLSTGVGLITDTQSAVQSIQPIVAKIVDHANSNASAVHQQATFAAVISFSFGAIVALIISDRASHSITRPLCRLLRATNRVAEGDFSVKAGVSSEDEIGELAKAFEGMTNTFCEVAQVANHVSSGNYSIQVPCRGEKDVLGIALRNMTDTIRNKTEENQRKTADLEQAINVQSRFRAALDASADAVLLVDQQSNKFIDMNQSACTSLGYSRDELLEMGPQDITTKYKYANSERTFDELAQTLEAEGEVSSIETLHCCKDGSTFPVEANTRILESEGRNILVVSVRDLSERKRSEKELEALNKQLVDVARQAGKAEIATSVLHNVGNVLNSINVSAGLIQDKVRNGGSSNIAKAIGLLEQNLDKVGEFVTSDDRGKHLPRFLIDANRQKGCEEQMILDEVKSLICNIDHVKAVVAAQQKHAKNMSGMIEEMPLVDLLEDAIHINTASMERHSVEIVREFDDVGLIRTDRQILLQILVNLIGNAKNACLESGHDSHRLAIRLRHSSENSVAIELQDNGMGIAKENLTKIFSHGFTTRKEGHGFGLHSAVLAAEELGGSLAAKSDGPGTGATFTLEIPSQGAVLCKV